MAQSLDSICIIPARGGSKGVVRKNIRPLGGIPLVVHTIRAAKESGIFSHVYVSTDDKEIASVAQKAGAEIIMRPTELASDTAPMPPVIEHAVGWHRAQGNQQPDYLFILQPSSPLRNAHDIKDAYAILKKGDCDSVMAVFEAENPPQWTLTPDKNGFLKPLFPLDQYLSRRQDLAPAYFDAPIYSIRTDAFLKYKRFLTDKTRYTVIPRERAVDIDVEADFLFAEFLVSKSKK